MINPKKMSLRCDECKCVGKSLLISNGILLVKVGITSVVDEAMVNFGP